MNILVTICARKGSKGLPGKNTKDLHGKPLILWTVEQALEWSVGNPEESRDVCVSTDSEEVVNIIEGMPLDIIERPTELGKDDTPKLAVIRHALDIMTRRKQKKYEIVVDLDVTNPIRTTQNIQESVQLLRKKAVNVVVSATKARKNPYFNQLEDYYDLCRLVKGGHAGNFTSRQEAPNVWDMNASITVMTDLFLDLNEFANTPTATPSLAMYEMPAFSAFDIDTELDFRIVEFLLCLDLTNGNPLKS